MDGSIFVLYAILLLVMVRGFCIETLRKRVKRVKASQLRGIVTDGVGVLHGVLVEECSADWKERLSETKTDYDGRFELAGVSESPLHYLRFLAWGNDATV